MGFSSLGQDYPQVLAVTDKVYEVRTSKTFKAIKYLIAFCDQLNIDIESMEFRKSTLEDVFFQLTGKKLPDDL